MTTVSGSECNHVITDCKACLNRVGANQIDELCVENIFLQTKPVANDPA